VTRAQTDDFDFVPFIERSPDIGTVIDLRVPNPRYAEELAHDEACEG
jgi:hypothetical protein